MPRAQSGLKRFSQSTRFPRLMEILFIVMIGWILWIGVLSDSSGHLAAPPMDSLLYVAGVILLSASLAYADWNEIINETKANADRRSGLPASGKR